jgi:hypothetical protein
VFWLFRVFCFINYIEMRKEFIGFGIGIIIFVILLVIYSSDNISNFGKETSQTAQKVTEATKDFVEQKIESINSSEEKNKISGLELMKLERQKFVKKKYREFACNTEYTIKNLCLDLQPGVLNSQPGLCEDLENFKKFHQQRGLERKNTEWCESTKGIEQEEIITAIEKNLYIKSLIREYNSISSDQPINQKVLKAFCINWHAINELPDFESKRIIEGKDSLYIDLFDCGDSEAWIYTNEKSTLSPVGWVERFNDQFKKWEKKQKIAITYTGDIERLELIFLNDKNQFYKKLIKEYNSIDSKFSNIEDKNYYLQQLCYDWHHLLGFLGEPKDIPYTNLFFIGLDTFDCGETEAFIYTHEKSTLSPTGWVERFNDRFKKWEKNIIN